MKDPCRGPVFLSTARPCPVGWGWVWNVGGGGATGVGLAHCWALRDQPVGWLLVPPSAGRARDVCGWWLVGLLVEICIVDASIFVAIVVVLCV
jgi:hypothetical protein